MIEVENTYLCTDVDELVLEPTYENMVLWQNTDLTDLLIQHTTKHYT